MMDYKQKTLVIFKPDVVQRQIVGEIMLRFERKGYKLVAMKMTYPTQEQVGLHYIDSEDYLTDVGGKALRAKEERGEDIGDLTPYKMGLQIREWNIDYLTTGPVVAMVWEGFDVINGIRKLIGSTNPASADIGTIRADFTPDGFVLADSQGRTTRTMLHASDSVASAEREIPLWFTQDEIMDYETAIEKVLYDTAWGKSE